jgi:type II restriction/modification system DNA methylase subunit YeeA
MTSALPLSENQNICFLGMMKGGPFDIDAQTAKTFLQTIHNVNGRPNSDVIKPRMNAKDVTSRWSQTWLIDFGDMSEEEAAQYEQPFEYVRRVVKPIRDTVRDNAMRTYWWLQGRSRPAMRLAIQGLTRYIVTPRVAKHRIFVWLQPPFIPDHKLCAIARSDDYFFGVLHSKPHEQWALATSSRHGDGSEGGRPTYTPTTCFETFPFPWPPGTEPAGNPRITVIAEAARELVRQRDEWLAGNGPPDLPLKQRTLTNLYNRRPDWLAHVHQQLDQAVLDAYGWPHDLTDEQILERLLALNLERAAKQGTTPPPAQDDEVDEDE